MKITCPNCQKNYVINKAKLPSGVKTAKCKVCGQSMPLNKAPVDASSKPERTIKIACLYCGQKHNLRPEKIPAAVNTINCKSCGRPVPLSQARSSAPVHSLKKESPALPADEPAAKSVKATARADNLIRFRCANCGKKYKIGRQKIPPRAAAVKCKACGHKIKLPPAPAKATTGDRLQPKMQPVGTSGAKSDLMAAEASSAIQRPRKNKWLFALAAAVLLIVIAGALASRHMVKLGWLNQFLYRESGPVTESTPVLDGEPFLALNLNVPLILDMLEEHLEPDKQKPRLRMMMTMMESMDLKQIKLYLYTPTQNQVLPVILAYGSNRQQLEKVFNSQEPFKKYFTHKSGDSYRLKKEALDHAAKYKLPRQPYEATLIDNRVALAPVSFSDTIRKNPQLLTNSPIAGFAQSIATPHDLASFAIRLPEGINPGWEKKIQNHPALQSIPQTALIADMGAAIMSQLTGSLKHVDAIGLGFRFTGSEQRSLTYAQQFRPGVNGQKIFRQLEAANLADTEINGIIKKLIELFKDQRYQHALNFEDNRLALQFSWSEKEDEAFLTALAAATIGQLFAGSMELTPAQGAVESRYTAEPDIVTAVDSDRLKAIIPQMISDSLFPGHYWSMGAKPQMTLDLDTIDMPNAALAELTYEVKSIQSPDGKNVLRNEENQNKPRIKPGSLFPANIALNVKEGTPPDDLAKAFINFHLTVPVALEVFDFMMGDKKGSVKDAAGIQVTLDRLEKDAAQVSASGGKSVRLIAHDQTGKTLASLETASTASSVSTRFAGIISTLKVVVTRRMLEYPFGIEVDLNGGKALVLSREPEVPARMRFSPQPVPTYVDFTAEDLKNLTVSWMEDQQESWNDGLSLKLPQGPFSGYAVWEVHFFGNDTPYFLTGSSAQGIKDIIFTLDKGTLKQVNAAFGKVQLNLHTDISRLVFVKKNNSQPAPQGLPSGDMVSVKFDKNEITYSAGNADVIQTIAYDARGKRLKLDQYTRNKGGKRSIYFWGIPTRFEIDVTTKTIEKLIPFEIKKRPVDEKAYSSFKQLIENQREVVHTIKSIDQARRKDRSYYGDDLAGLYYIYDRKQKKPLMLISREIAHSDPAGQDRFGYQAQPYKGYYFTVLSGVETNSAKKKYNRREKKSRYTWQKGTITTTALTRHPDLVAIPEDKSQPTFLLQWGQVFMKPLDGEKLEYLPAGYYNKGWVEAKYIDS